MFTIQQQTPSIGDTLTIVDIALSPKHVLQQQTPSTEDTSLLSTKIERVDCVVSQCLSEVLENRYRENGSIYKIVFCRASIVNVCYTVFSCVCVCTYVQVCEGIPLVNAWQVTSSATQTLQE